jgi:hypothetical protein
MVGGVGQYPTTPFQTTFPSIFTHTWGHPWLSLTNQTNNDHCSLCDKNPGEYLTDNKPKDG